MISSRRVGPEDWWLWRELRLAALAEAPGAFGSVWADWAEAAEDRWRERLRSVPFNLVLDDDAQAVGMVSATGRAGAGAVELISLWVAPSHRGRGVGAAAIRAVVDWMRGEYGHGAVELAVKADNEVAIRLYRRLGFLDEGVSSIDPSELVMRLHVE